jgi:hypothetical protein
MVEPTSDSDNPLEAKQASESAKTDDRAARSDDGQNLEPSNQRRDATASDDQHASAASRTITSSSNREERYSSEEEDSGHPISSHRSSDNFATAHRSSDDDDESRRKREKRLAMNRASARERRRRKRVHTEELEQRVVAISRQCISLQKTNEGLQLYIAKLETNLAQANATIAILGKNDAPLTLPPQPPLLPPDPRRDALAASMQEQDRVRELLGMIQQQDPASRLTPSIAGRLSLQDENVQRQAMLDILSRHQQQQQHLRSPDAGLASLMASRAGTNTDPPLDPAIASLLGRAALPGARGGATGGGDSALLSYLGTLQRGEPNPLRMLNFGASGADRRANDAALVSAALATGQRGVPIRSAPPPKKRRKENNE